MKNPAVFFRNNFWLVLLMLSGNLLHAQSDYFFKSADGELAMELSREGQSVNIALFLTNASQFEEVMIERSLDAFNNFGQCKYIKFNGSAQPNVVIVKRDDFPLTSVDEAYYRIKTVSTEGVTRIYPSVRLPGLREISLRQ